MNKIKYIYPIISWIATGFICRKTQSVINPNYPTAWVIWWVITSVIALCMSIYLLLLAFED